MGGTPFLLFLLIFRISGQGTGPHQFSALLQASGVYSPGDNGPTDPPKRYSYRTVAVDKMSDVGEPEQPALPVVEEEEERHVEETTPGSAAAAAAVTTEEEDRRPKQVVGEADTTGENQDVENVLSFESILPKIPRPMPESLGFPRLLSIAGRSIPEIPRPMPRSLGFPAVMSFFDNFNSNVDWAATLRNKRSADPARLGHVAHVLPPPHDVPPPNHLPLFPPLDKPLHPVPVTPLPHHHHAVTPLPHHHHAVTPTAHSAHHVTITTPSHHVSHGVVDHGSHHEVSKEHHQLHGHEGHHQLHGHEAHLPSPTPLVLVRKHSPTILVEHKGHLGHHAPAPPPPPPHPHPVSGYAKPAHGGSLEEVFGVTTAYHTPAPVYHPPAKPTYHPPTVMVPPAYHPPEPTYHPTVKAGYAKPAHGGSLETIFGITSKYGPPTPTPVYHPPEPAYHPPEPAYHPPEPAYHPPEPTYHAPEPAYHPPEPAYHAPEPAYHPPEPAYHPPEPAYHPPEPAYHAPEPAYHAPVPKPEYVLPKPGYKPDYAHPTGDYIPPKAHMAGHPFSLEHVFALGMPNYYMQKYPHMAHDLHSHGHAHPVDNYVEPPTYHPPEPVYKAPKHYDHPVSGYAKPAHGASLEEIFGVHSKYHSPKPAYHPPEPEYHPPAPAYHPPTVMVPPTPDYHPPPPTPVYHPPKPTYDQPTGYAAPQHGGSLEAIFGVNTKYHAPPPPPPPPLTYAIPTTYKPSHPTYKSLPPLHPGPPGYSLHYMPYDAYEPLHPETLAHHPPVHDHHGAAHILLPNPHPIPPPLHRAVVKSLDPHFGARVRRSPTDANPDDVPALKNEGLISKEEEVDTFVTRTKIINNSQFPQIVIIPQEQSEEAKDQFRISINKETGQIDMIASNNKELEREPKALFITPQSEEESESEFSEADELFQSIRGEESETFDAEHKANQLELVRAEKHQRELLEALMNSMNLEEGGLDSLKETIKAQEEILDGMEQEEETESVNIDDETLEDRKIQLLEEESLRQTQILEEINRALQEMDVGPEATDARLQAIEDIATGQKDILEQLLATAEVSESHLRSLQDDLDRVNRERKSTELARRRVNLRQQIRDVAELMAETRKKRQQRLDLAGILPGLTQRPLTRSGRTNLGVSGSGRSMAWWERMNSGFRERQRQHRQIRLLGTVLQ